MRRSWGRAARPAGVLLLLAAALAAAPVTGARAEAPEALRRFQAAGVNFGPLRGWRLDAASRAPGVVYLAPQVERGYRARVEAQLYQGPPPPDLDVALGHRSARLRQSRRGYVELGRSYQQSKRGLTYGLLEYVCLERGVRVHGWEILARTGPRERLLISATAAEGAEARYEERLDALTDAIVVPRS